MHWAFFWREQQGHEVVEFGAPVAVLVAIAIVVFVVIAIVAVVVIAIVGFVGDKHGRIVANVHAFIGPFGDKPI